MSSLNAANPCRKPSSRAKAIAVAAAVLLSAGMAGCGFQPMYGPTASGAHLTDVMKTVDISTIPGRVGQRVRNELIYGVTSGGEAKNSAFRLDVAVKESLRNTLVARTGDPQGQVYELNAEFRLVRLQDNQVVFSGFSASSAPFDRAGTNSSVFADVRAKRDAEDRAARSLADNIKTRLAAYLSGAA